MGDQRESNLELELRRLPFYPLNYRDKHTNKLSHSVSISNLDVEVNYLTIHWLFCILSILCLTNQTVFQLSFLLRDGDIWMASRSSI